MKDRKKELNEQYYNHLKKQGMYDDMIFKMVMRDKACMMRLLTSLPYFAAERFRNMQIGDIREQVVMEPYPERKQSTLDMLVKLEDGTNINVEMQFRPHKAMPTRARYYCSQTQVATVKANTPYEKISETIIIFITRKPAFGKDTLPYTELCTCRNRMGPDGTPILEEVYDATKIIFCWAGATFGKDLLKDENSIEGKFARMMYDINQTDPEKMLYTETKERYEYIMKSELNMSATEWVTEQIAKEYEKDKHDSVISYFTKGIPAEVISECQKMELSEVQKILKEAGLMA